MGLAPEAHPALGALVLPRCRDLPDRHRLLRAPAPLPASGCASCTRSSSSRIPETDDPKPRPGAGPARARARAPDEEGRRHVRWGDGETGTGTGASAFSTRRGGLRLLAAGAGRLHRHPGGRVARLLATRRSSTSATASDYPAEWGDTAPEGSGRRVGFYNTMFMWPLLTFGWELFLETCLDPRFERIMDEFAEINRRVFRAFARLPVNFVVCHDDIVNSRGPVCSPAWMHKYIFPRYEEFWGIAEGGGQGSHLHGRRLHGRLCRRRDRLRRARHHQRAVHRLQGHRPQAQGLLPGRRGRQPRPRRATTRPRSRRWCAAWSRRRR